MKKTFFVIVWIHANLPMQGMFLNFEFMGKMESDQHQIYYIYTKIYNSPVNLKSYNQKRYYSI